MPHSLLPITPDNRISSSAVAERPLDASCLSVVSFNIPTAQFFLLLVTAASDLLVHKINFENICIRERDERDGRTEGQTRHDNIGRAYASHRAAKTRLGYSTVKKL